MQICQFDLLVKKQKIKFACLMLKTEIPFSAASYTKITWRFQVYGTDEAPWRAPKPVCRADGVYVVPRVNVWFPIRIVSVCVSTAYISKSIP